MAEEKEKEKREKNQRQQQAREEANLCRKMLTSLAAPTTDLERAEQTKWKNKLFLANRNITGEKSLPVRRKTILRALETRENELAKARDRLNIAQQEVDRAEELVETTRADLQAVDDEIAAQEAPAKDPQQSQRNQQNNPSLTAGSVMLC